MYVPTGKKKYHITYISLRKHAKKQSYLKFIKYLSMVKICMGEYPVDTPAH